MCEECQSHNGWMSYNNNFEHSGLYGVNECIAQRGLMREIDWVWEARAVLSLWLRDREHRDVLLMPGQQVGIAWYNDWRNNRMLSTFRIR